MLDSVYRPALAQLIHELSKEIQFIVTTHGHDILNYGDRFYGVNNINQVIKIWCCNTEVRTLYPFCHATVMASNTCLLNRILLMILKDLLVLDIHIEQKSINVYQEYIFTNDDEMTVIQRLILDSLLEFIYLYP